MAGVDQTTRWDVFSIAASAAALVGTALAIRHGASLHRSGPVVGFLALWGATASYVVAANFAARRRALRLRSFEAPLGVRLCRPIWIAARDLVAVVGVGAALGAVAAGVGFPSVGVGILLTIGGMGVLPLLALVPTLSRLTFEPSGLRVHVRRDVSCFVPWTSMVEVTVTGPAHHRPVNVRIVDPGRTIASVTPDSRRNRERVSTLLWMGEPRGEALVLYPWTAGLDSPTLARLLRAAIGGPSPAAN